MIGAFLHAIIDAEGLAAKATVNFIREVGFDSTTQQGGKAIDLGALKTVTFQYQRPGNAGKTEVVHISVPLLSLVPVPILQIQEAEISFQIDIIDIIRKSKRTEMDPYTTRLLAKIAEPQIANDPHPGTGNTYIRIKLNASDIPSGLKHLFHIMDHAVHSKGEQTE